MKCISLWQPFATLIAVGAKRFETRSWSTSHRGPIAIHAAKKWNEDLARMCWSRPFYQALEQHVDFGPAAEPILNQLPFGAIVAVAEITDVKPAADAINWPPTDMPMMDDDVSDAIMQCSMEQAFGDFSPGRFAWKLENVRTIEPLACRGRQGLFDIDLTLDDLSARVIR